MTAINDMSTAIQYGRLNSLQELLRINPGTDINQVASTITGNTLLHLAAAFGEADIAHFLIEQGANVNPINNFGHTPLNIAAIEQHGNIGAILIANGGEYEATPPAHNIVFNNVATSYWTNTQQDYDHQYHQTNGSDAEDDCDLGCTGHSYALSDCDMMVY